MFIELVSITYRGQLSLQNINQKINIILMLIRKIKDYFNIDRDVFNRVLAIQLRASIVLYIISLLGFFVFDYKVIFANPLTVLFLSCLFGSMIVLTHRLSIQVMNGDLKAKRNIYYLLIALLLIYAKILFVVIPWVIILWYRTTDKYWQDSNDIYSGKFSGSK